MRRRTRPRRDVDPDRRAVALARRLAALLSQLGLSEIEVESGGVRVRLHGAPPEPVPGHGAPAAPPSLPSAGTATVVEPVPAKGLPGTVTIEAPMVGTFYRAPSPTAAPYVQEGDVVKEGQVVCIIEAMKLMNEIESKLAGRIVKILVENGQAVEYGEPLFRIEPQR
jgi:acetyl-CoA carboxylase biotin carboxyl carrier protein